MLVKHEMDGEIDFYFNYNMNRDMLTIRHSERGRINSSNDKGCFRFFSHTKTATKRIKKRFSAHRNIILVHTAITILP